MRTHELASFLASDDPAERLRGLEELKPLDGPAAVPVLIHLLHQAHTEVRPLLLSRIAGAGKAVIAQSLDQLLESDPPHPESALFYLSLEADPAYNGLLLALLPLASESLQSGIIHVLSRTADPSVEIALAPMAPYLKRSAREAAERLLKARPLKDLRNAPPAAPQRPEPPAEPAGRPHTPAHTALAGGPEPAVSAFANFPVMPSPPAASRPRAARATAPVPEPPPITPGFGGTPTAGPDQPAPYLAIQARPSEGRLGARPPVALPAHPGQEASLETPCEQDAKAVDPREDSDGASSSLKPQASSLNAAGSAAAPQTRKGLRERIEARKKTGATIPWRRKLASVARAAAGLTLWAAATAGLGRAAWESVALPDAFRFAVPAIAAVTFTLCLAGWRRIAHEGKAALTAIALAACVAAALRLEAPGGPAMFALLGQGAGFWGNLLCLATLGLLTGATLVQAEWPRAARLASIGLAGYIALGFVRALVRQAPFELALVEQANLPSLPWPELQPPALFVGALLPAAMLLAALHWLRGTGTQGWHGARGTLVFLLIPFAAGASVLERNLIPTALTAITGRSIGAGAAGVDYVSAWDVTEEGSGRHRVELLTRGHAPGTKHRAYVLNARVNPSPVPGKPAELFVTIRDARLGLPIKRLLPGDLEVYEDGARQQVASLRPATEKNETGYLLTYVKALPPVPSIRLTSPATAAVGSGMLAVAAETDGPASRVDLFVDREPIATFERGPYQASEPVEAFAAGRHRVRAVARDRFGRTSEDSREIVIGHSLPDLAVLSPREGGALWGDSILEVSVGGLKARRVELTIDGTVLKGFDGAFDPVQVAAVDLEKMGLPVEAGVRHKDGLQLYRATFDSRSLDAGAHHFGVRVTGLDGRVMRREVSAQVLRTIVATRLLTPQFRSRLAGKVPLVAEARSSWPEFAITRVEFRANGQKIATADRAPWVCTWDTAGWAAGKYRIEAVATAANGEVGAAAVTAEVIHPDLAISLDDIWDGMTLASPMELRASLAGTSRTPVREVTFKLNDRPLGADLEAPFACALDPAGLADSEATLAVQATLTDGRRVSRSYRIKLAPSRRPGLVVCALRDGAPVPFASTPEPVVTVDGRPVDALAARPAASGPTAIALVVDASASMASSEKQNRLREAVAGFLATLGPEDRVALVTFNEEVAIARPFTTDRASVAESLASLRAYGASALNDGVFRAVEALGEEPGRRVAVVLTDGIDQNIDRTGPASTRLLPQVVDLARARHVAVYTVGVGRELRQENGQGERALSSLAVETGGLYCFAAWPRDLGGALAEVARNLASETVLSWNGRDNWGERWHPATVSWPGRPDLSVRAAPGYVGM
jgi:VWFA-related protein